MCRRLFAGVAAAVFLLGGWIGTAGRVFADSGGEAEACVVEIPKTGCRLNPTIGGMALAFSGVALCVLADERGCRK